MMLVVSYKFWHWLLTQLGSHLVVLVVCVVPLELITVMMYTPSHNVIEKVVSPVCHCDRCGQCLAYSITFSESLRDSYWDVKPCKEHFSVLCHLSKFNFRQNLVAIFILELACVAGMTSTGTTIQVIYDTTNERRQNVLQLQTKSISPVVQYSRIVFLLDYNYIVCCFFCKWC